MRKFLARFISFLITLLIFAVFFLQRFGFYSPPAYAQGPASPVPTVIYEDGFYFDTEVTELGKNSERSRQLLWWVFSNPGIHSAPVLAKLWSYSRNIVYVFIVVVIIAIGFSFIILRRRASTIKFPRLLIKIGLLLLYVTFSYILILGLVQLSEIIMLFFIEKVGGKDLFGVIFAGAGNSEANYTSFIGYKNINPLKTEIVNTSMFLIRFTNFTYNVMAIILILRTIILWFLLIISPFLALLIPFVFVRNVGWIWIGVFFQWLFYGPLVAIFLAALTQIWVSGIPYPFDFSRVDKPEGQIYPTSINIIYGGPSQTISPTNSVNYIDTYAEYVISLVMLWTAILLPWLLLRIFRDYCCEMIVAGNNTLTAIFDRIRQFPPPAPPPSPVTPTTSTGMAAELPFRRRFEERVRKVHETKIDRVKEISRMNTSEIAKSIDISVSSLSDVSRLEMSKVKRVEVQQRLDKISSPQKLSSQKDREYYSNIRKELQTRAAAGDKIAQRMLVASEKDKTALTSKVATMIQQRPSTTIVHARGIYAPAAQVYVSALSQPAVMSSIAQKAGTSENQVRQVLQSIPAAGVPTVQTVTNISHKTKISESKVEEILNTATAVSKVAPQTSAVRASKGKKPLIVPKAMSVSVAGKTVQAQVSVEDYEETKKMWLNHYREAPIPISETIKDRQQWLTEEEKTLTNISNLLASSDQNLKQKGFEQVAEILPFMLLGEFTDAEILAYLKAKLEADKQVRKELEIEKKAQEEARKKMEEEETLLEIPIDRKKKKEKARTLVEEKKMELPKDM